MSAPVVDRDAVVAAWLEDEWKQTSDETNRMSNSGHPCDRYLFLRRTEGEKAKPAGEYLRAVFRRGHIAQKEIARVQMIRAGFELYEQETRFNVREGTETLWRGHIDGVIRDPRKGYQAPVHVWEAKMINTWTWNAIHSLQDMLTSPKHWIRGYPAQVMLYMYAKAQSEVGILHLIDSETWLPKFIEVPLDYTYVDELLQRGRRINAAVVRGAIPDPIDYGDTCERCSLLSVCMPDAMGKVGLQLWERPEFETTLEEWEAAKLDRTAAEQRFRRLDGAVKAAALGKGEIAIGDFWISTKEVPVKEYTVQARVDQRLEVKRITPKGERAEEVA